MFFFQDQSFLFFVFSAEISSIVGNLMSEKWRHLEKKRVPENKKHESETVYYYHV